MITLEKLKVIAKAKFSDKSNLGDWYQSRNNICKLCPYYSPNKESLSIKEAAMVSINLGKPTCLACGCESTAKNSVREEICGLIKLGKEPLWEALPEIQKITLPNLTIENLNKDKVDLSVTDKLVLDYGNIKFKSNSDFQISLSSADKKMPILNLKVVAGCSCTVATPKKIGGTYYVNISYNTKLVGSINKTIIFTITQGGEQKTLRANLVGTVNK